MYLFKMHSADFTTEKLRNKPWQCILFISGPFISIPLSSSKTIPDEVMLKGKAKGGEIGDFASLINLWPARNWASEIQIDKQSFIAIIYGDWHIGIWQNIKNPRLNGTPELSFILVCVS